jgi:hypothetical protein
MGLLSSSKSSSFAPVSISDNDNAAEGLARITTSRNSLSNKLGGVIKNSTFNFGSDGVALEAIDFAENSINALQQGFESSFTKLLNSSDSRIASAENNIAATRDFAAGIIAEGAEGADDRIIKLVTIMSLIGVGMVLIQSGTLGALLK